MRGTPTTAIAILLAATAMAAAADVSKVKAPVAAPAQPADWSGVYAGIAGGYGSGSTKSGTLKSGPFSQGDYRGLMTTGNGVAGPGTGVGSFSQSGYLSGGFVGAQKQRGNMVFGLEADINTSGLSGSSGTGSRMPSSVSR